jgi:asparagine synthase (glutamine-hydrolysing)
MMREDYCIDNIRRLLRDSIKLRMMSDVPFGVLLSGGIDSSLNVALMSELMTRPVETFTVGYKSLEQFNELDHARTISNRFQTNHHEILIDENDAIDFLPKMVWHLDEPNADNVCVPVYFVSKLARDNNTIVVQVGEGADEEFSGYTSYIRELRYRQYVYKLFPRFLSRLSVSLFRAISPHSLVTEYARRAAEHDAPFYGNVVGFSEELKRRTLTGQFIAGKLNSGRIAQECESAWGDLAPADADSALKQIAYYEFKNRLPELLLMRVDKMSMAVSVEARVPFLDHRIVEFAFRIPDALKIRNGQTKYILKKAAEGIIPNEIIYRKKQGFNAPVVDWLRNGRLMNFASEQILNSELLRTELFSGQFLGTMLKEHSSGKRNHAKKIWSLLILGMWHKLHFE